MGNIKLNEFSIFEISMLSQFFDNYIVIKIPLFVSFGHHWVGSLRYRERFDSIIRIFDEPTMYLIRVDYTSIQR